MSMGVSGNFSPYDIIAFVQQHTEKYASMVKAEMQSAEDRSQLVREIADLSADLEDSKNRGDWTKAKQSLVAFMDKHPETWGGGSMDMIDTFCNLKAWSEGGAIVPGTYTRTTYDDATTWNSSFHSEWSTSSGVDAASAQSNMQAWIQRLNDWKDKVSGDDKIGMMTLQSDADRMKNLYEEGSNLVAKLNQIASTIIGNIGRG